MAYNKRVLKKGNCYRADSANDMGLFTFRFYGYEQVGDKKFIKGLKNHDGKLILINPDRLDSLSHLDYNDPEEGSNGFNDLVVV